MEIRALTDAKGCRAQPEEISPEALEINYSN